MVARILVGKRKNSLTDRQKEILLMSYGGLNGIEIGELLSISPNTVSSTLGMLKRKFGHAIHKDIEFMEYNGFHKIALELKPGWLVELQHIRSEKKGNRRK